MPTQTYMFSLYNNNFFLQTNTQISVTGKLVWDADNADMTPGVQARANNQNQSNIISLEITFPSCGVQPLKINDTTSKLIRTKQITFDQSMEKREGDVSAIDGVVPELKYGVDANGKLTTIDIYLETTLMILGKSQNVYLRTRCGDSDGNVCNLINVGGFVSPSLPMSTQGTEQEGVVNLMLNQMSSSYLLFSGDFNTVSYCIPKFIIGLYKKNAPLVPWNDAGQDGLVALQFWYPNFNSGRSGALGMDLDFVTTTPDPNSTFGSNQFLLSPTFDDGVSNIIDNGVSQIGSFEIILWDDYVKKVEEDDPSLSFPKYNWGCGGQILQSIDVKIGEQKLFTDDIAQVAPLEEHPGVMPNQRTYITANNPRYFEININSVAEPECTSGKSGGATVPDFLRDRKMAKMGRSAVMSSQRSTLRSQLRKMGTLGFQATKGKLSAGSYKKDVVIRRKPKTLHAAGSDYIQLKKWRALSHGEPSTTTTATDTIPVSDTIVGGDDFDQCVIL